jgi:lysophospholipid acyltransferase (LPLAT)-like uncharacterized protein
LKHLGIRVIVARKDNAFGVREVIHWLGGGERRFLALTSDGPVGPARVAKSGVSRLARLARVPLHPLRVAASCGSELDSWDRCILPGGHGAIAIDVLPEIQATKPLMSATTMLERRLNEPTITTRTRVRKSPSFAELAWARAFLTPLYWGNVTLGEAPGT